MIKAYRLRELAQNLRLKASWFMDPPSLAPALRLRLALGEIRALRSELDRAAFALDNYADHLGREEAVALAQFGADSTDGRNAHRKRALAMSALLEELGG